jgi:nitroreductase
MVLAHADAGFISQNVYLYCASQGLGTVVMGAIDRDAYGKVLNIGPDQFITYAQPVGYQR